MYLCLLNLILAFRVVLPFVVSGSPFCFLVSWVSEASVYIAWGVHNWFPYRGNPSLDPHLSKKGSFLTLPLIGSSFISQLLHQIAPLRVTLFKTYSYWDLFLSPFFFKLKYSSHEVRSILCHIQFYGFQQMHTLGIPWWSRVVSRQGAWVWSLAKELRFYKPPSRAKK